MLKKLIKILTILALVIWIGLVSVKLITIDRIISKSFLFLQGQIEILQQQYDKSFNNDLQLLNKLQDLARNDKTFSDYIQNKVNRIDSQLKEVDYNHILKGDVSVGSIFGNGAGTIVKKTDKEMYVLTCHHVVAEIIELNKILKNSLDVTVAYTLGDSGDMESLSHLVTFSAKVIKYEESIDLALLKISMIDDKLDEIKLAEIEPEKGDIVYSVGTPLGLMRTVSKGILANKLQGYYVTDSTTTFGNSGGGLYNKNGELIGVPAQVPVYKAGEDTIPESSLGFSINLSTIKTFLEGAY